MEHYSTGEAAHLCGITIRTVQYYDVCGLIRPSAQTSAGHRLYSEHDIKRMQFVCTLRSLGFSIADIKRIFHESEGETLIQLMLTEQIQQLHRDITHKETQIRALEELLSTLKSAHCFSISHLEDSMAILQNKKPLRRIRKNMFITAAVLEILEIAAAIYSIKTQNWLPLIAAFVIACISSIFLAKYYYRNTAYICPNCHAQFKPQFWKFFWAFHTPRTRKLTCPSCGQKRYCLETADTAGETQAP